jgi:hypothetical protein
MDGTWVKQCSPLWQSDMEQIILNYFDKCIKDGLVSMKGDIVKVVILALLMN